MFWVLSIHLHQFVLYVSVSISVNKLTTTTVRARYLLCDALLPRGVYLRLMVS